MRLSDIRLSDYGLLGKVTSLHAVRRETFDNPELRYRWFGAKRTPIPTRRAVGAQLYALACGPIYYPTLELINLSAFITRGLKRLL